MNAEERWKNQLSMKEVEEARCRDQQRRAKLRAELESVATWAIKEDENRKSKRMAKDAEYTQKELEKIDEEKRLVTEIALDAEMDKCDES